MKIRLFIAAMSTVLLAGCAGNESTTPMEEFMWWGVRHPNCNALQQAERQNAKDFEAYCYTEQTQNSLKCEQAKHQERKLQVARERITQAAGYALECSEQF